MLMSVIDLNDDVNLVVYWCHFVWTNHYWCYNNSLLINNVRLHYDAVDTHASYLGLYQWQLASSLSVCLVYQWQCLNLLLLQVMMMIMMLMMIRLIVTLLLFATLLGPRDITNVSFCWTDAQVCCPAFMAYYISACNRLRCFHDLQYLATRSALWCLDCTKFVFRWGSTPDPTGGAHDAPPDPL